VSKPAVFGAIDLGASSGRVMAGTVADGRLALHEVHRFANRPRLVAGVLRWDVSDLLDQIVIGLAGMRRRWGTPRSVAIDSWGCDYGLLSGAGELLNDPVHYRDPRTAGAAERVLDRVSPGELYERTGTQLMAFNTLLQLSVDRDVEGADRALLMPDLFVNLLSGHVGTELTAASTTQMLDIHTGQWCGDLLDRLGLRGDLFPDPSGPGSAAGHLLPDLARRAGMGSDVAITTVASHDTASAVLAAPARTPAFAYISCGTWALVGVELTGPVLSGAGRDANFSNEIGLDGTIRYLRNVTGLWLLQECLREWRVGRRGLVRLLAAAAERPGLRSILDVSAPALSEPGTDMPSRLRRAAAEGGFPEPADRAGLVRCILDSLALAFRRALRQAAALSGTGVDVVHLVGGGAGLDLLAQLSADASGLPVEIGPLEATAWGNVLVQARTAGEIEGDRWLLRRLVRSSAPPPVAEPSGPGEEWDRAEEALFA